MVHAPSINFRSALTFMLRQPNFRRSLLWGGVLMLLLPPIGWIVALGYRSILFNLLIDGEDPACLTLPERTFDCFKIGLKAVGVIYSYYLPFLVLFMLLGVSEFSTLVVYWREVLIFFCSIPLFLPLCMLGVPAYYLRHYAWLQLEVADYLLLAATFGGTTFLMPAAFMQVGLHGRYRAAYYFRRVLRGLSANLRAYLQAWCYSASVLTLTVVAFPIFPWITFWAYLVFGFLFLNCAYLLRTEQSETRFRNIRGLFVDTSEC